MSEEENVAESPEDNLGEGEEAAEQSSSQPEESKKSKEASETKDAESKESKDLTEDDRVGEHESEESFEEVEEEEELTENDEVDEVTKETRSLMCNYTRILEEIKAQNKVVDELKIIVCDKSKKQCLSKVEERELKSLRCCLEKETLKLTCLLKKATCLQEKFPCPDWEEIPVATTFEEDNMPIGLNYNILMSACKKSFSEDISGEKEDNQCSKKKDENNLERLLDCLLKKLQEQKPCKPSKSVCSCHVTKTQRPCKGTVKQGLNTLQCQKDDHKNKVQTKPDYSKICKELDRCYNMQEKLVADNADLEGNRFKLQEEILCRDRMIECLQQKIQIMQCELQKLLKETKCEEISSNSKLEKRLEKYRQCLKFFQENITCMESSIERLKCEIECLKKERDELKNKVKKEDICKPSKNKTKCEEIEELKLNYQNLLAEYCKKESELREVQKQVGKGSETCDTKQYELNQAEIQFLKEKIKDFQEEQEEFKCLLKEQSEQMDDYRNKYLIAQQKVEEQNCIIEKLEMNNKRIEDQINLEIQKIKSKFQEKLQELAKLPKLLENEQIKLASVCKEKEDLEQKLRLVCKELKALKAQLGDNKVDNVSNLQTKIRELEQKLVTIESDYNNMKMEKELLCKKLCKTEEDLDTLRTESAKIIARTKERAESQRQTLQCRIDKLEKELAQCRATACMSIADREDVIKEMKGQLSTLSYSFDSAQKQIKTLKNHISFLSNETTCTIKC